jgi:hypothetical protein
MPKLPITVLVLVAAVSSLSARDRADVPRTAARSSEIEWAFTRGDGVGEDARLDVFRRGSHSSFGPGEVPQVWDALSGAAQAAAGDAVSFTLAREAGSLACTGRVTQAGHAAGICSFEPNQQFVSGLNARQVALDDRDDLFGLTLVDAHLASVDGLKQAGFRVADSGDLMTVSALQVTPEFAAGLKAAGLDIEDLDDLVSARALGVDPAWLSAMAAAGFPGLDADQAIAMRSLGITPDYAQRMARVLASSEGN